MTTATLPVRSMAFKSVRRVPLHQRVWESLMSAGASRAAAQLRREALLRADTHPAMARQLLDAASQIRVK